VKALIVQHIAHMCACFLKYSRNSDVCIWSVFQVVTICLQLSVALCYMVIVVLLSYQQYNLLESPVTIESCSSIASFLARWVFGHLSCFLD